MLNEAPRVIRVRPLTEHAEFSTAVELQRAIWGFDEVELLPVRLFVTALKVGGQALGAFEGERMIGFCLAIPGIGAAGERYLHSHMLGVLATYRNAGVGRMLKLAQREDALRRGIDLVEWTFDPLEIKNAYFNLERLGAIARRYNINQYGITTSPLQGFLPTDRLVAEWWLNSKRVADVLATGKLPAFDEEVRVEVPAEIYSWKEQAATRPRASEVQLHNRELFIRAFSEGLACLGYEHADNSRGAFLLGRWDEGWSYAMK